MSAAYQIKIIALDPSDFGPQAVAQVIIPNGDAYRVRCLARPDGTTEIFDLDLPETMKFLVNSFGSDIVGKLREATCRAYH